MRRAAIAIALALTACGVDVAHEAPPVVTVQDFSVRIDPVFTPDETQAILDAFDEWFEAIPEARVPIRIAAPPNVIRMTTTPPLNAEGFLVLGNATRARISIWAEVSGNLFPGVVRHEIGHFLGGAHTSEGVALSRYPIEDEPIPWHCISAADIAAVCEGRGGCKEKTTPSCR